MSEKTIEERLEELERRTKEAEERAKRAEKRAERAEARANENVHNDPMRSFQAIYGGGPGTSSAELIESIERGDTTIEVLPDPKDPNWLKKRRAHAKRSGGG